MRLFVARTRNWLLVVLLASLALLAAYQVPYTYRLDVGDAFDWWFVADFHGVETDSNLNFRWSSADSSILFPAVVQNQNYRLSLRLAAGPRPATAPAPEVTLRANGVVVKAFKVKPELTTFTVNVRSQIIALDPDLHVQISVPTFDPSKTIADSNDSRSLGVIADHVDLEPVGLPTGIVALPALTQWLGWSLAVWLWFELVMRAGWAKTARARQGAVLAGGLILALGLILARPWVASAVWYVCAALALAWLMARPFASWINELRATHSIPFGFLHTLGISNPRLRAFVELGIIALLSVYYFIVVVLPLRKTVLGDFLVYYAGANVWLQNGNFYDQSKLQLFNSTHSLLNGQIGPFTSPPSALLLFAPFAVLPLEAAKTAWLVFNFSTLAVSGAFMWLAVRRSVTRPPSPVWLGLMFVSSQSLRHSFDFGQLNPSYLFLFAFGLWAWTRRHSAITGATMVIGGATKVFSAIFLPYFLLKRAWRALAASIVTGAVLVGATALLTDARIWLTYVLDVLPDASEHRVSAFDQSLMVFLRRSNFLLGLLPDTNQLDKTPSSEVRMVALIITVVLLSVTAWWFSRNTRVDDLKEQLEFVAVIVVMLLILPRVWEHYLMWLILPFYLILTVLANRPLSLPAQIGILFALGVSWLLSQDGPDLFTRPDWPTALISIGLFGSFLTYLCLLYLLSLAPKELTLRSDKVEMEARRDPQVLKVKV